MRFVLSASAALSVLAILTGCAHTDWQKAGAGPAIASSDLRECTERSRPIAPAQFTPEKNSAYTNAASDAQRDTQLNQFPNSAYARDVQTQQSLLVRCMEGKGYQLVRQ